MPNEGWLIVEFYDAWGNKIEKFVEPLTEALNRIREFVVLHGDDPDGEGHNRQPGQVHFRPYREDEE